MASCWWKCKKANVWWRVFVVVAAVVISAATAFVKQHSVIDIAAAIPLGLLAEVLTFHVIYPKKKTE
jgi:hypothetical protein